MMTEVRLDEVGAKGSGPWLSRLLEVCSEGYEWRNLNMDACRERSREQVVPEEERAEVFAKLGPWLVPKSEECDVLKKVSAERATGLHRGLASLYSGQETDILKFASRCGSLGNSQEFFVRGQEIHADQRSFFGLYEPWRGHAYWDWVDAIECMELLVHCLEIVHGLGEVQELASKFKQSRVLNQFGDSHLAPKRMRMLQRLIN
jgi:hypothetical protein